MSLDFNILYQKFFKLYNKAHNNVAARVNQQKVNEEWNKLKKLYQNNIDRAKFIEKRICELEKLIEKQRITNYFPKTAFQSASMSGTLKNNDSPLHSDEKDAVSAEKIEEKQVSKDRELLKTADENARSKEGSLDEDNNISNADVLKRKVDTPAQDKQRAEIAALQSCLDAQKQLRDSGLKNNKCKQRIKEVQDQLKKARAKLRKQLSNVKSQQKLRAKNRRKFGSLTVRDSKKPRLEDDQPGLHEAITSIAMFSSAAHGRRQTEEIRSCKTLNELFEAVTEMGYKISKSALYTRMIPRDFLSNEGKRHTKTVPVKLCTAQNDIHKSHSDSRFCTASIRYVESLASMLGPDQVGFISQDDKARVPIGLTAAHKQSPLLMHLDYRVKLPDHDWVIAEKHKLIPSVYAGIVIKPNGLGAPEAVTYSGPTYIAIRSGKHSSSTAATHAVDFSRLLELQEFDCILKSKGQNKPVLIFSVDGGPDENPRYPKTIAHAIDHFKKYDLDAIFIVTNAPGRSAYNRVERRMAPLSYQLSGVLLIHNYFGNHLDSRGRTIDELLELANFEKAGRTLAELWNELIIDYYRVFAEYIKPQTLNFEFTKVDSHWYATHVRESQYFLQIVKCKDKKCCGKLRSNLHSFLPTGFFPPPCLISYKDGLLNAPKVSDEQEKDAKFLPLFQRLVAHDLISNSDFKEIPYDFFCPSLQSQLKDRCCKTYGLYFASKKSATSHMKSLQHTLSWQKKKMKLKSIVAKRTGEVLCEIEEEKTGGKSVEWIDAAELQEDYENVDSKENDFNSKSVEESCMPVVESIEECQTSLFVEAAEE